MECVHCIWGCSMVQVEISLSEAINTLWKECVKSSSDSLEDSFLPSLTRIAIK